VDVDDKKRVSWFLGLTCDFWAENGKRKIASSAKAMDSVVLGRAPGREADFSAALLTRNVSSFGRNDDSLVWEKRTGNGVVDG
jgi:hypothetical protein